MLKILRYEISNLRTLPSMFDLLRRYPHRRSFVVQHNSSYIIHSSQLYFKMYCDFLKSNVPSHLNLCKFTVKTSQEPLIHQRGETVKGKKYPESESVHHHKVLEESDVYANTLFKQDSSFIERYKLSHEEFKDLINIKDWNSKTPYHVATAFVSFGIYSNSYLKLTIDDEKFDGLTMAFVNKCSQFTDDQLIDCMAAVPIWPESNTVKEKNYLKIWKSLDNVCLQRFLDWTVDKILYMMDLWYHMKLARLSGFVYKGLNKVSRKSSDLTRAQMIQILFYISLARKLNDQISMREYEYYLQKHITHMSIGEIGICALAFFKTKTSILNEKLLMYTMQRLVEEINTVHDVTLTAIAKALRFSAKPELAFTLNNVVEKITEHRISSLKLQSSIHVAHIISRIQFFNVEAVTKLAEKFCKDPSDARLKDIERVAFLLSLFNYIPPTTPDILNVICQQLDLPQHVEAGNNHVLTLISLVYFLTLQRVFPEKQIEHLLSKEFLDNNFENRFMTAVQLLKIDYNRVLEGPKGSEHLLSPSMKEYLARKNSLFLPDARYAKLTNFDKMMLEVINLTKEVLGGEEYCLVTHVLPHFPRADIIFRLDSKGQPVPIPEEMRSLKPFQDVIRPVGDGWRSVVVANRNMYMFNVPRLVGESNAKLRQLSLLGYTPVVISYLYWMGEKNKSDFLKLKYFTGPG